MKGTPPLLEDQIRGLCKQCHKNLCMPGPRSKLGYKKYVSLCSSCAKKRYGVEKNPYRQRKKPHCERCGFLAKDPCQLDVHHKDRNHSNNTIENLETLCANCHRLEHREERKEWARLGNK